MAIIGNLLYHSQESTHIATVSFLLPLCWGNHYLLKWCCHHHHWPLSKLTWQQLICCQFLLFKFSIIIRAYTRSVLSSFYALFIHVVSPLGVAVHPCTIMLKQALYSIGRRRKRRRRRRWLPVSFWLRVKFTSVSYRVVLYSVTLYCDLV